MHGKSLSKLALEQQKPVSFTSVIAMAKLYLDPSEKDLRWVLNVAVEGHQASWKKTGKGNNKDGSVIYGSSGFRFAGGKRFFHVTSIIRVGITFSSAIKTWQKKAWKHISVCALQGASLRFNYPADVKMWREKKKIENWKYCQEFFVVSVHIRRTATRQERQHPHDSHCFCRWQGIAGEKEKHSECSGALLLLSTKNSTAGTSVCTSNTPQLQSGAWRGSTRAAGTHSESQLSPLHLCLPGAAVRGFPMAWLHGWSSRAAFPTPAHPLTVGRDGLHEVYGPNVGK